MEEALIGAPAAPVPFVDLAPIHVPLKRTLLGVVGEVLESNAFVQGPDVAEFEAAFAEYSGTAECVGVASGLDALRIALAAAGLERGDEVVVPAQTFAATFEAVTQAGGVPVAVDVSTNDYCIDVDAVDAAIGSRTAVVLPVHLFGQMADVVRLRDVCARHGVALIEDSCQAHGAMRDTFPAGAAGIAGCFSFYPAKNLGAIGDGGAIVSDDHRLVHRARALREHGQTAKYHHEFEGWTSRLDTIQAAVLLAKLEHLDEWNGERRAIAAFYANELCDLEELRLPPVPEGSSPVWHLYVVRTAEPNRLAAELAGRGIATGRHYPEPPPFSRAYAALGHQRGEFPVAEDLAATGLSLPIYPGMTTEQCERVVEAIHEAL